MHTSTVLKRITMMSSALAVMTASGMAGATAMTSSTAASAAAAKASAATATEQTHLTAIITKGDQEISRRLTSLGALDTKINAATKLTASDKTTLTTQVNTEVSGLATLKAKLDAETTLDGAKADATSIYTDYRVYALITPKIWLVKASDDQQVAEAKLAALATKLQARITAAKAAGKDVTAMQAQLSDMTSKVTAATAISSTIETNVISLQPTDYNSNHAVLSGDGVQLRTAHSDNTDALADAKAIIASL